MPQPAPDRDDARASARRVALDPDPHMLERIRAGDRAAFEVLFERLYPGLRVYVARWVGSSDAAQDIVQDLFLAVWQHRAQLNVRESLVNYLFRAARNRALNAMRGERNVERVQHNVSLEWALDDPKTVHDAIAEAEIALAIEQAVAALPPRTRQVFTLHRQRGLTYREIAVTMGIARKTVEAQMGRALRMLRARLAHLLP
jgi:RNA polymerase sigma-70 factor (ECF subfamily)